jgi:hypothetical protein
MWSPLAETLVGPVGRPRSDVGSLTGRAVDFKPGRPLARGYCPLANWRCTGLPARLRLVAQGCVKADIAMTVREGREVA